MHAQLFFEGDCWWLRDLQSRNGTYVNGERIEQVPIRGEIMFTLGQNGPQIMATVEEQKPAAHIVDKDLLAQYEDYYLKQSTHENAGERTIFVRQAFQSIQRRQGRRNAIFVGVAAVLVIVLASYGFYQQSQANRQQELAQNLFYQMKSVEMEAAKSETTLLTLKGQAGIDEIYRIRERRHAL